MHRSLVTVLSAVSLAAAAQSSPGSQDAQLCAKIANQTWSKPIEVHRCLKSFPFNATLRDNIVDVVSKTFDQFHTTTSFHLHLVDPYIDSTVDILGELKRIKRTAYKSDFEFHQDVYKTVKRLGDGHANYFNYCYDYLYATYLPFPLTILTQPDAPNTQNIYIAPEAYEVISKGLGDEAVKLWETALQRNLSDFDGAQIVSINSQDPRNVVDAYARVSGNFQAVSIRENSFFASYRLSKYRLGDFAQVQWPTRGDSISLTLIRKGTTAQETYEVPYLSRQGTTTVAFTDAKSLWENNCRPKFTTNGNSNIGNTQIEARDETEAAAEEDQPDELLGVHPEIASDLILDGSQAELSLPQRLFPTGEVSAFGTMYWFVLEDGKTAVLWMPSFQGRFRNLQKGVLEGIDAVKAKGATRLLIDLTNNEGGTICLAQWLHRVLAGSQPGLDTQTGFDGSIRAKCLAQKMITEAIKHNVTNPNEVIPSWYNPQPGNYNWLNPPINLTINGVAEKFSQKVGDRCLPFTFTPPATKPFEFENIALMSNGRCASACSLFSILMRTKYNVKTVVVGGKQGTIQQYCGFVGGQASNFITINSELKTWKLKGDPLSPPDFLTNSYLGFNWKLAWSISDPNSFEEFRDHRAEFSFPLLPTTVNNPWALWNDVSKRLWPN